MLVIDISRLNATNWIKSGTFLKMEAGAKNTEMYDFCIGFERISCVSGGTCPTGSVRLYAWRRLGLSSRLYGLGDGLVELELVNYEGMIIKANKSCNADLFGHAAVPVEVTLALW